jgi:hypothetical protein
MSVPQAIAQGFGVSAVDHRDVGAALRMAEVFHKEPGGESRYVQDVTLSHHQRLLDVGLRADAHRARTAANE